MIINELCGRYASVYTGWVNNNLSNINTVNAAADACYRICGLYERPYFIALDENHDNAIDDFRNHSDYIIRQNATINIYNEMMQ